VAIAPARAKRPGAAQSELEAPTAAELEQCPFCAGREDRTPPETLRIGNPWHVRVVPNLYPAFERQEVVVHTPRHARTLAELSDEELVFVADAWRLRREAVPEGYLHALVNEGREAGSSLPHTHSQLVWLPEAPPETQRRVDRRRWSVVAERDGLVLACPYASRLPYELVLAPAEPRANAFADELLPAALRLLGEAIRRVHGAAGASPLNAWLHESGDWHLELLPRLSILAGVELGAGWWINALAPEDAAAVLRETAA
jgi:UDPglucose--hexose-1-phosphate uridylyltransferase